MKILESKYDAKCKACGEFINAGDRVRWSKEGGVSWTTCMACPHEPQQRGRVVNATTGEPAQTDTAYQSLARRLDAALSDGQALRAEIGRMAGQIQQLTVERDALMAEATQLAYAVAAHGPTLPTVDDDCPI
jgi:Zn ribbon nucleic-acid-binding protein